MHDAEPWSADILKVREALNMLYDLLESHAPSWYTVQHHDKAETALHCDRCFPTPGAVEPPRPDGGGEADSRTQNEGSNQMETQEEACWLHFEKVLSEVEAAGLACIKATKPSTLQNEAKADSIRAKLLRALWETIVAIRFRLCRANTYPVSEVELEMVAEELLATVQHKQKRLL